MGGRDCRVTMDRVCVAARFRTGSEAAILEGRRILPVRYRFLGLILAWVAVFPFSPVILAQTAKGSGAAKTRTAATPDLSGVWMKVGRFGFTKEEPPMQPWAEAK